MEPAQFFRDVARRPWRFVVAVALLVVMTTVLAACGGGEQPAATEAVATQAATTEAATEAVTEAATTEAATEAAPAATTEAPEEEPAATEAATTEAAAESETGETAAADSVGVVAGDAVAGQYIANLTGGCGCHFDSDLGGLAGGRKFEGPFGVVYAANLTSDAETGLAGDSDATLISILRTGQEVGEDGAVEVIHPIMPYKTFSVMSDKDVQDLVAYLRTLEPISNAVPERELKEEPQAWTPSATPPAEAPTEPVARGEYLVTLANCGSCHTPKNEDGSPKADMMLAGALLPGDAGEIASNITPDEATGIGKWTEADIAKFMLTGTLPDGKQIEGAMAQQIQRRFSKLTEGDAAAIAAYLKSIPAVSNEPTAK